MQETITGQWWWETWERIIRFACGWRGSWSGRGQTLGYLGCSSRQYFRRCYYSGRRRGSWPPTWNGKWTVFSTGSRGGSPGVIRGGGGRGAGSIHRWRQLWRRQYPKRLESTSKRGRIRPRNILRLDQFWTSVSDLFRDQEPEFIEGGGNRRGSI